MTTARGVLTLRRLDHDARRQGGLHLPWARPTRLHPVAFGGNGPVVAADIAAALGIRRIVVPLAAGVFSGFGLLRSDVEQRCSVQPVLADALLPPGLLSCLKAELRARALEALTADGYDATSTDFRFSADLRYFGQAYELNIAGDVEGNVAALVEGFHAEHERTYGHRPAATWSRSSMPA